MWHAWTESPGDPVSLDHMAPQDTKNSVLLENFQVAQMITLLLSIL